MIAKNKLALGILTSTIIGFSVFSEVYFAAVIGLPVLYYFVRHHLDDKQYSSARYLGFMFGLIFFSYSAAMLPFLVPAIRTFARTPLSISLLLSLFIILLNVVPYFLPMIALVYARQRWPFWSMVVLLSATSALWPNMGNLTLGDALGQFSLFHPFIRTLGVGGLTFCASICTVVSLALLHQRRFLRCALWLGINLTVTVGVFHLLDQHLNPPLIINSQKRVTLVQTLNLTDPIANHDIQSVTATQFTENLLTTIAQHNLSQASELAILPESGIKTGVAFPWNNTVAHRRSLGTYLGFEAFAETTKMNLLIETSNTVVSHVDGGVRGVSTLAALLAKDGAQWINFVYKNHLVPFLEYVPYAEEYPVLKKIFSWTWATPADLESENFVVGDMNFRALICYDSLFADPYWQGLTKGARFFVAMTNNAYLKGGSHYQHSITRMRVLEFGRPLLYVANYADTGIISDTTTTRTPANLFSIVDVNLGDLSARDTFYARVVYAKLQNLDFRLIGGFYFALLVALLVVGIGPQRFRVQFVHLKWHPFMGYGLTGAAALAGYFLFSKFVLQFVYIPTASMFPTISPDAKRMVCRFRHTYERGQIVSAHFGQTGESVVKRVLLLPGDQLLKDNRIKTARGEIIEIQYSPPQPGETYCREHWGQLNWPILCESRDSLKAIETEPMRPGEYFLLGDNRENSQDSRSLGPIPIESLKGSLCF